MRLTIGAVAREQGGHPRTLTRDLMAVRRAGSPSSSSDSRRATLVGVRRGGDCSWHPRDHCGTDRRRPLSLTLSMTLWSVR